MSDKIKLFFENYGAVILQLVLVLAGGIIVVKLIKRAMKGALRRSRVDESLHKYISSAVVVALYVVLFISCAGIAGIPTSSFVTLFGVVGLALSLSLQNSLSNMFGGVLILMSKPFQKGDYIEVGATGGTVDSVGIIYTKLKTFDNKSVLIPNSDVVSARITDFSSNKHRRLDLQFSIEYGADVDRARQIILLVAENSGFCENQPVPEVVVSELARSAVVLLGRFWVNYNQYGDLRAYMLENVLKQFAQNGIAIAHDRLVVSIKE